MKQLILPIWLILILAGLPQLSETAYTPALPNIAETLQAPEAWVEYTLSIYLFGFAIGTLFWGRLSDRFGRKPCILAGLFVFILGCVGCYFSHSIEWLLLSRFIQAFGGSTGSVLGQAICRDAFQGQALGRVYALVGAALAAFPAIGPVVGGVITQYWGWPPIFLFLMLSGSLVMLCTMIYLPETHPIASRQTVSIAETASRMLRDTRVMILAMIVAGCNGIGFSYFAEGSFYLIDLLGLSPSQYGLSFIGMAIVGVASAMSVRQLHKHHDAKTILYYGLSVVVIGGLLFSMGILSDFFLSWSRMFLIGVTILSMVIINAGVWMTTSTALSMALVDYKGCIGTASSLFGCLYYALISLITIGMGLLHNGTMLPMPLYFLGIGLVMWMLQRRLRFF